MSPLDGVLDLFRVDPMPGNVADVVHIPIEDCCAIQHSYSIYKCCIYSNAAKPSGSSDRATAIDTPGSMNVRIIRRSEVSAPAIRYLALELPAGERFSPDAAILSLSRRRSLPSFDTTGFALWPFFRAVALSVALAMTSF